MTKIRLLPSLCAAILLVLLAACSSSNPSLGQDKSLSERIVFFSDRANRGEVYTMNPDGTGAQKISFDLPAGLGIGNLKWSEGAQKWVFTGIAANQSDIYTASYDGKNVVNLTNTPDQYEDEAALSPDGSHVVYASTSTGINTSIFTRKADGSEVKQLSKLPVKESQPDWLDNSARLIINSSKGGSPNIYEADIAKGTLMNLSAGPGLDDDPILAADRSFFVFTSDRAGMSNVFLFDFKSKQIKQLTRDMDYASAGRPSPDGKWVVFRSKKGGVDLYLVKLSDLSIKRLTQTPEITEVSPVWSPDSQQVLFAADNQGVSNLYTVGLDGKLTSLSAPSNNDYGPRWIRVKR